MKKPALYIFSLVIATLITTGANASRDTVMNFYYNAISCTCAQWSETGDTSENKTYYYLEAANDSLPDADKLWNDRLPLHVRATGRIVSFNGFPKTRSSTKGDPAPARVFEYTKLEFVDNGSPNADLRLLVDSLVFVTNMPYICDIGFNDCGDKIFWDVVRQKQIVIPLLIEKLSDTTNTLATVNVFGGRWAVGDIAFAALEELIKGVPTFELLGVRFDKSGCGYCAYWDQVRESLDNRTRFQSAFHKWYETNKHKLVWVESDEFRICDCRGKHPNGGHFELK